MVSHPFFQRSPRVWAAHVAVYAWTWLIGALLLAAGAELLQPLLQPSRAPLWATAPVAVPLAQPAASPEAAGALDSAPLAPAGVAAAPPAPPADAPPWVPISHLRVPAIGLDVEVVLSPFVEVNGGGTWHVPPFRPGHAEFSASAGAPGNAILFGHVVHPTEGAVFKNVPHLKVGDRLEIAAGDARFTYSVTRVFRVSRTDVSVLGPAETPALTLVTCTGAWLPHLQDFAERLIVRAALSD